MSLFQVPGWSVPSVPVAKTSTQVSKKRKRPSENNLEKIHATKVNLAKLVKKLNRDEDYDEGVSKPKSKRSRKRKDGCKKGLVGFEEEQPGQTSKPVQPPTKDSRSSVNILSEKSIMRESAKTVDQPTGMSYNGTPSLTALQKGMKQSLDGARFRWINEVLYKSDSTQAHQMMQDDPKVYEEYHTGFRYQVRSWPTNPVSHYISILSLYPAKTVIADLGCGDATLARALVPKGLTVLSYDLVSDDAFVIEADTHVKIPLPGSEGDHCEGEGQVVDVVVCALSLMGTNWPNCIREAWRILKYGGGLEIAEVASRFTDVDEFTSLVTAIGFKLNSKDDRNTHFTLFNFEKAARNGLTDKKWATLSSKGNILKPCEYKRR